MTRLSPACRRVVAELARDGATNAELAARLFLAEQTVKFHLMNAMQQTGTANRTALALWWIRGGQYHDPAPCRRSPNVVARAS